MIDNMRNPRQIHAENPAIRCSLMKRTTLCGVGGGVGGGGVWMWVGIM